MRRHGLQVNRGPAASGRLPGMGRVRVRLGGSARFDVPRTETPVPESGAVRSRGLRLLGDRRCWLHSGLTGMPASASRRTPRICSSVYRFFIGPIPISG